MGNGSCQLQSPLVKKVPREDPQIFPGDKLYIILPLMMRKANAARIPNRSLKAVTSQRENPSPALLSG